MSFRPTRRAWAEIAGAVVLAVASIVVLAGGVTAYRRAAALDAAYHAYFRTIIPGEGGLEIVNDGLDHFPDDPALLALKGAILAARPDDLERSADAYALLKKADAADGAAAELSPAFGRIGLALVDLEMARREGLAPAGRAALLEAAERELSAARRELPRRPEPDVLLGVIALERGQIERALENLEAAERAPAAPVAGSLLTLYLARAEAFRRRGAWADEARALEKAVALAPARSEIRDRLARAIARRTADPSLGGADAEAAIAAARRAMLPLEPVDRFRRSPLYGLEPEHVAEIREAVAIAEARSGNLEGARRTLAEALREAPRERSYLRNLAAIYGRLHADEKNQGTRRNFARLASDALRDAAAAPGTAPAEAYEWLLGAALFSRAGEQYESAIRLLDRAAKVAPAGDLRLDRAYAVIYDAWNRPKQAIEAYRRAIGKAPADPISLAMEERLRLLEERRQ